MAAPRPVQQQPQQQQHDQPQMSYHRELSTPGLLTAAAGAAAARAAPPPLPPPPAPPPSLFAPIYLIVLNYHLPAVAAQLWPAAALRIAADGGANRIHDEMPALARRVARERRRWLRRRRREAAGPGGGEQAGGRAGAGLAAASDGDEEEDEGDAGDASALAFVPDALVGDLDSVRPEVRGLFEQAGALVADLSHDQDSTDLDKCLAHVEAHLSAAAAAASAAVGIREKGDGNGGGAGAGANGGGAGNRCGPLSTPADPPLPPHHVVVVGALGGRLDHTLSNLGALHRFPRLRVTIWSDGNTVRLVRGGAAATEAAAGATAAPPAVLPPPTRVVADRRVEGPACGVVPLAGAATVTSRGLRWDMRAARLSFGVGGLLSTSNLLGGGAEEGEERVEAGEKRGGGGSGGGGGRGGPPSHEAVVELAADSDVLWMVEARDSVPADVWDEAEARAAEVVAAHQRGGGGGA